MEDSEEVHRLHGDGQITLTVIDSYNAEAAVSMETKNNDQL